MAAMPKPLTEMSAEEMEAWCAQLRSEREALRDEAIRKKKSYAVKASVDKRSAEGNGEGAPAKAKPRGKSDAAVLAAQMLELMRGKKS